MLTTTNVNRLSLAFGALSDGGRIRIIKILSRRNDICVSDIARILGVSVPAASQQLKVLEMAGLVEKERCGQMVCYRLNKKEPFVKSILKVVLGA